MTMTLIIIGIILIGLSLGLGIFLGKKIAEKPPILEETRLEKLAKSPLVQHFNVLIQGTIEQIQDRTLVLTREGESITVPIQEGARIVSVEIPEQPQQQLRLKDIDFKTLKVGDKINVLAAVKPDEELKGMSVTLIPPMFPLGPLSPPIR